ncbi:MAG: hypothetical protein U1E83_07655 [Methylotetracoccus sp.]
MADYRPLLGLLERIEQVDLSALRAVVDVARREAPREPELSALLGNFHFLDGRFSEALIELDASIAAIGRLDEVPSWILLRKLGTLCALGMSVAARSWFDRVRGLLKDDGHVECGAALVSNLDEPEPALDAACQDVATEVGERSKAASPAPSSPLEAELSLSQLQQVQDELQRLFAANVRMEEELAMLRRQLTDANDALAAARAELMQRGSGPVAP